MNGSLKDSPVKIQKIKLGERVLQQLQGMINSGEYSCGNKLPSELELMRLLNAGRSTIREAVKTMVYAGVLDVRQGDGTYIISEEKITNPLTGKLNKAEMREIREAIKILVVHVSGLAAKRRTEADLKKMKFYLDKRKDYLIVQDTPNFIKYDFLFYQTICKASQNKVLTEIFTSFKDFLGGRMRSGDDNDEKNIMVHTNLFLAIQKQSSKEAMKWASRSSKEFYPESDK